MPLRNKADNACHIAMAYTQAGKRDEAIKYLQLARQLDNKSPLLSLAEMAVQPETKKPGSFVN
jgi:hypothetical protein